MKCSIAIVTFISTVIPVALSLPANFFATSFELPTCGAKTCLDATNGLFDACEPHDLKCLCSLKQSEITRYVEMVQPCIDGDEGSDICTDGAIYQYKDLLTTVCADDQFDNKVVEFPTIY